MRQSLPVMLALLLAGCPPPVGHDAGAPFTGDAGPPRLELGTGSSTFEDLADGGELEVVHGPQGGWHVVASVRITSVEVDGAVLTFEVLDGEEVLVRIPMSLLARRLDMAGPSYLKLDELLIFDIAGPEEVVGRSVEVRATLSAGALTLTDARTVTLVDRE